MARPRSYGAHIKVILAAMRLFGERGIDATSMDAIASASKVSKATIYNHWADKEALLLEVMLFVHGLDEVQRDKASEEPTGDLLPDIVAVLTRQPPHHMEEFRQRLMPTMIAYSAVHPAFGTAWRHKVMEPPREHLRRILERGIEEGRLPADLDLEVSMALLLGPMLYRHIFQSETRTIDQVGEETAAVFYRAYVKGS